MNDTPVPSRRFSGRHVAAFVAIAVVLTAVVSFFVIKAWLFPSAFKPVTLSAREEKALEAKVDRLDFAAAPASSAAVPQAAAAPPRPVPAGQKAPLEPEAYSEKEADRTIRFTEREVNALLAKNTDWADKVAIDLSRDLVSAKILIPLDEDLPVLGGKILRVKAGLGFSYADGRPVVMLRGITVMGVPLPNAWLGGLKNVDLVKDGRGDAGFWKAFADGVEYVRVEEGCVTIRVKE